MSTVDERCKAYNRLCDYWDLPERLYMGTMAMREAGTRYLPRMHGENVPSTGSAATLDDPYLQRLNLTFLYNGYKHAVQGLRGKVFSNPAAVTDDSDTFYRDLAMDVDSEGNDINTFAMDLFTNAMHYGLMFVLTDFPEVQTGGRDRVITLADVRAAQARPFFVSIAPTQVLGWRIERRAGKQVLTQFRFCETVSEHEDDFNENEIEQIRVFYPDRSEVYRRSERDTEYRLYATYKNSLGYIPIECFYTHRLGVMQAISPLYDLATKNQEHWQESSMQKMAGHASRSLILFGAGIDATPVDPTTGQARPLSKLQIGMHQMILSDNAQATLQYLEFPVAALEHGKATIDKLEDQMAVLSLGPILTQRPGSITATEAAINTAQAQSILWSWAQDERSVLERSLVIAGEWMRKTGGKAEVSMNTDFGIPTQMGPELDLLYKSVVGGQLSRDTFWQELKRRDVLQDSFDPEEESDRLEMQGGSLGMMGRESQPPMMQRSDNMGNPDNSQGDQQQAAA